MNKLFSAIYKERDPFGIFNEVKTVVHPEDMDDKGVLILWGGADISPSIYNQQPVHTDASYKMSHRDTLEVHLAKHAISMGIPIIGVCRGAQLMCALSGGTLFQHIDHGHHQPHKVITKDGEIYTTSSCHHQALNLENTVHEILAKDFNRVTMAYTDKSRQEVEIPEIVWFPKTKAFAIQGHPEWLDKSSPFIQWCNSEMKRVGVIQ